MTKTSKFSVAVLLQVLVIFVIIFLKMTILTSGTEVFLSIKPIDPRDALRGDYVSFQYDISTIEGFYARGQTFHEGDTIYVILTSYGKGTTIKELRGTMPTGDETFIKGFVTRVDDNNGPQGMTTKSSYNTTLHVTYGVEQYFIPEGKGQSLPTGSKTAVALVALDERGNAVVKQILIDGKPWP